VHPTQQPKPEKVIIVSIDDHHDNLEDFEYSLNELNRLIDSAGGQVQHCFIQKKAKPDSATYIGKGKIEEIQNYIQTHDIDSVVFNNELNPRQTNNLTEAFDKKILDRTEVILDIFAHRAQTKEAKLQVELAQLEYLFPRLTHRWEHLSRLGGGIGTRGPGETQLEMDRRLIRNRISALKRDIKAVANHRQLHRQARLRRGQKVVAIVGYTNSGKSTLLRTISKKDIYVRDQLFATLDPVIRKVFLPELNQEVLFADTVGFIKDLPHHLIDAFKSTLEEAIHADLLLIVVDAIDDDILRKISTVYDVLADLKAIDKRIITVFNKIDLTPPDNLADLLERHSPAIAISALHKEGIDQLLKIIAAELD
jgi:GTP-binding protein HflX